LLLAGQSGESAKESKTRSGAAKIAARDTKAIARLVRVPLPISGSIDVRVRRQIEQVLDSLPTSQAGAKARPVLVLEFFHEPGKNAASSQFTRALDLALFLSSDKLRAVKTVAWLPEAVTGHAVLPVMACEQIVVHPEAALGAAGVYDLEQGQESVRIDPVVRRGYEEIAQRRRVIPAPAALAMLDRQAIVYRVATLDGVRYEFEKDVAQLEEAGKVVSKDLLAQPGELALLSGQALRDEFRFASHLAKNRQELASALEFSADDLLADAPLGDGWRALRVELSGPVTTNAVAFLREGIEKRLADGEINFIWLSIDSPGGAPAESESLAMFLAGLAPDKVRTVAYVQKQARADAVLPALACDQLVMAPEAVLGGPGAYHPSPRETEDAIATARALGKAKHRDWSLIAALLNQQVEVAEHVRERNGERRYFSSLELAEQSTDDKWVR
jgi:membrane-bound serine protease (ClpP class)